MAATRRVRGTVDLLILRRTLERSQLHAREALRALLQEPKLMQRLKFERLGCDPLDPGDAQNLAEQIDQQATYSAGVEALQYLLTTHPGKDWDFAPGAHGAGHDIASTDGSVAAEVFAAVKPENNKKLEKDVAKIMLFPGAHRYVFFSSPGHQAYQRDEGVVRIVSLGIVP